MTKVLAGARLILQFKLVATPDHACRQFEMAYQLVLQSRRSPGTNIR